MSIVSHSTYLANASAIKFVIVQYYMLHFIIIICSVLDIDVDVDHFMPKIDSRILMRKCS